MSNIPRITKETIERHRKVVEKAKEDGSFKDYSNEIMERIFEENNDYYMEVVIACLKSDSSEDYKKGYLAGVATFFDIVNRQNDKLNSS